jgi:peptide chain release factor 3
MLSDNVACARRPALNGFEIIEQLEKEFGLQSYPVTWPIGSGEHIVY